MELNVAVMSFALTLAWSGSWDRLGVRVFLVPCTGRLRSRPRAACPEA